MKKKHKQIIFLIFSIAIIGTMAFVYFFAIQEEPQDVLAGPVTQTGRADLISRSEADVLRITFWDGESLTYMLPFYDEDGVLQWSYSAGGVFLLNPSSTRDKARLAWALTVPETLHEDSTGLNLADFELAPARLVVEASYYDGTSHSVRIGGITTDLRHHFLMIDDDPAIYLITAFTAGRLKAGVNELIDLTLPVFNFEMATYVSIRELGRDPIEFTLRDDSWLRVDHPPGWDLIMTSPFTGFDIRSWFAEEPVSLFESFRLLRVAHVSPSNLDEFGLAEPRLEVEFHDMFEEVTLLFGNVSDDPDLVYVKIKGRPHVFLARHSYMQLLLDLNPLDFLLRFILLANILDVYALTISSVIENESFEIHINHDADDSRIIRPTINCIEVSDSAFRTLYQLIIGLMVDAPVEAFMPAGEPVMTVIYHFSEQENRNFRLFARDAQFYYVSLDGGYVQFVTNRRAVEHMIRNIQVLL